MGNMKFKFWQKILDFFYHTFSSKKYDFKNVRRVYFGLRIRLISFIGLTLLMIMFITGIIFSFLQRKALFNEKKIKSNVITKIVKEFSQYYLDNDINTSQKARLNKYREIDKTCKNFKSHNEDLVKIMIVNDKGKIQYSTHAADQKIQKNRTYFNRVLHNRQGEEYYDFGEGKKKYRAVTYPVFITHGMVIDVLNDFEKYYEKYHSSKNDQKINIYRLMWKKYQSILGKAYNPEGKKFDPFVITVYYDIDYLFLRLFNNIMHKRQKRIKKEDYHLWKYTWLNQTKQNKLNAQKNDQITEAEQIKQEMIKTMKYLKQQIDDIKLLGAIGIIFDLDKMEAEVNENVKQFVLISLIISFAALIIFAFLINHLVKNLKTLQKGALDFAGGDFDSKIKIITNDETGRLSDILNNMAEHVKEKLHMEKFISKSTKSMIKKSNSSGYEVLPGKVQKIELSFIFADVRGFTSFSESHLPEVVIDTLNLYFDLQYKSVRKYYGDIDDYVGDQIMAHFAGKEHKERSLKVALEIREKVAEFNKKRASKKLPFFDIGIGVHSGLVVTGNIGSSKRMDFACVGDAVNTTSRLCSQAKPGEILVSDSHVKDIKKHFSLRRLPDIEVKGKKEKLKVYRLLSQLSK